MYPKSFRSSICSDLVYKMKKYQKRLGELKVHKTRDQELFQSNKNGFFHNFNIHIIHDFSYECNREMNDNGR
ncbi:hypothetical protein BpHYR1_040207 [Brachionus plicatilis]|uniref:Uncharacterized protein n=1 Tax=Brachionus plicatilis TaxID=10195 RepID=A0A3M7PXE8_BRAPC|nr:hypothetical protein BpHYR1_040207 [Brachionus plicatilis]